VSSVCQETGLVTGFDKGGRALVRIRRVEACHTCAAKGACQALGGRTEEMTIPVENTLGVQVGDSVILGLPEGSVIKASAAVYLLPAGGLVGGAMAAWGLAGTRGGDGMALIGAGAGLLLGLAAARIMTRKMAKDPCYQPKLVQKL
jgi:sigma-E factor negative regulatory protein RseC